MTVRPEETSSILVVGDYRSSLAVVRELARAGYRVIVGQTSVTLASLSRHAAEIWTHPPLRGDGAAFLRELDDFLTARPDIAFLLPVSEHYLVSLLPHRERIPVPVLASGPTDAVLHLLDKAKTYRLAEDCGLSVPKFALARNWDELLAGTEQVGFPCVVKPNNTMGAHGVVYQVMDRDHLRRVLPSWPTQHESLLVQRFAAGVRYSRLFVAHEGELLRWVDVQTLRTARVDGSGRSLEQTSVASRADLDEPCARLFAHLGLSGIGSVQFLLDEATGGVAFMEINPRLGGSYPIASFCGLTQAQALIAVKTGADLSDLRSPFAYPAGKRSVWLHQDLIELFGRPGGGIGSALVTFLGRAVGSFRRADFHQIWSWDDPLPATVAVLRSCIGLAKRVVRSVMGSFTPGRRAGRRSAI